MNYSSSEIIFKYVGNSCLRTLLLFGAIRKRKEKTGAFDQKGKGENTFATRPMTSHNGAQKMKAIHVYTRTS